MDNNDIKRIYLKHSKRLVQYATRLTGSVDLAEQYVHDAFLLLITKSDSMTDDYIFSWLCKTIYNLIGTNYKKEKRANIVPLNEEIASSLDKTIEDEIDFGLFDVLPKNLTILERTLLIQKYGENRTYAEMAALHGANEAAMRKKISRIVEKCRKKIK